MLTAFQVITCSVALKVMADLQDVRERVAKIEGRLSVMQAYHDARLNDGPLPTGSGQE